MHFRSWNNVVSRGTSFFIAIILAVTAVLASFPLSQQAHASIGSIAEYSGFTSDTLPGFLAVGPDNNIWYTNDSYNPRVGKVTVTGSIMQYLRVQNYQYPAGIAKGSDGNMWFSEQNASGLGTILKMSTDGTILGQYTLPSPHIPRSLTLGPDGAIWFTESSSTYIGKITSSGVITEYQAPASGVAPAVYDITTGSDGNMWFTIGVVGSSNSKIGKITTSGVITTYPIATYNAVAWGITTGSDGNMWFTEKGSNKIGRITTSGVVTEYNASPNSSASPEGITTGGDGALWYTESGSNKIGRITTSGVVTEYVVPDAQNGSLEHIITGPDGAVWFSNAFAGKIGRLTTELSSQVISFASNAPTNATLESATYRPIASATSGLPVTITVDSSTTSVCSMDGSGTIIYHASGICVIDANQPGSDDYQPAIQVQQSFMVLPVNSDTSVDVDCPTTASLGSDVECTITIRNEGPASSSDTTLGAVFSSTLTNASLSDGGVLNGRQMTWTVPALDSDNSLTLTFHATASVIGRARLNASLLQTSPDPDELNNIATALINVL